MTNLPTLLRKMLRLSTIASLLSAVASYRIVTFGDYGTGSSLQRENAVAIDAYCAANPVDVVLTLGDNFYNGPLNITDSKFKRWFTDMYGANQTFWGCLGNHDYAGNVTAQFDFTAQAIDPRYKVPSSNYTLSVPEADLTVVFIDTPRGCPSYMSAPYGDCNELCMEQLAQVGCTNSSALACWLDHVAWLNSTLQSITTTWKIVAGHHPISQENVKYLTPALAAHGVQAYLAGHVHNLQHNTGADGVEYFVSGAGAFDSALHHTHADGSSHKAEDMVPKGLTLGRSHMPLAPLQCPVGTPCYPMANYFFANGPGFLTLDIDNTAAKPTTRAQFHHANGTVLYDYSFTA